MKLAKIAGMVLLSTVLLLSIACATPTYHLSTSVNGQGSVMPSSGDFLEDEEVLLLANPASGWWFDHWEGAASGNNGLVTITMSSDKSVTAFFVETGMSSMSEKGFSISLPEGWEETPAGLTEEGTAYYSISACSGSGAMVIVAEMDASGLSLQTFYEASKIGLEAFGDYDILSEEEITIDGMPAKQMIYTVVIGGSTSQMLQCVLVKGDTGWLITFSCEPECWDTMESTFNAMLNSFKVGEGGSASATTTSEFTTYTDTTNGFSMPVPASWTDMSTGGIPIFASPSPCSGIYTNVNVISTETSGFDLQDYYELNKNAVEATMEDHTFISESDLNIAGVPAKELTYTTSLEGDNLQQTQYYFITKQTGWIITFTYAPSCYSTLTSVFSTMLDSFQVLD